MRHEEEYEDDWKAEAPLLASLSKNAAPEVPEGYFDALPSSVMARIKALEAPAQAEPEVANPQPVAGGKILGFKPRRWWSAAAAVALLIAVGAYFMTRPQGTDPLMSDATLTAETLEQLAALEPTTVISELDASTVSDEELFAMLGSEATSAFADDDHAVERDEAYEYLQDVDLDAIDLQGLDIDLNDLN
jgi:hypothetical protein